MKTREPRNGIYIQGFKGKGMCKNCGFSYPDEDDPNFLYCSMYQSKCKLVSRNCLGIPALKTQEGTTPSAK